MLNPIVYGIELDIRTTDLKAKGEHRRLLAAARPVKESEKPKGRHPWQRLNLSRLLPTWDMRWG